MSEGARANSAGDDKGQRLVLQQLINKEGGLLAAQQDEGR